MLIAKYGNGSIEQVEEFERKYEINLDEYYRKFLIKYNGGETPNTIFKKGKVSETVRYLYGLNVEQSIEKNMIYFDWKKNNSIPIGVDNFGNYFYIGISANNNSIVYFCDHERGFKNIKISDTFQGFVEATHSEMISDFAKSTIEEREARLIANGKERNITDGLRNLWRKEYEKYKDIFQEEVIL